MALVGVCSILSAVIGTVMGIVAAWRRNTWKDHADHVGDDGLLFDARLLVGMLLLVGFAVVIPIFPVGGITDPGSNATGIAWLLDSLHHMFLPALTLTLAYLGSTP